VNPAGLQLADLAVVADAVSTPYQAIRKSELQSGDLAIMIGVGGIGGFGVQIAAALGAIVVAIDVNPVRLDLMALHGASVCLNSQELDFKSLKTALREVAREHGIPTWRYRIFEMSGSPTGQELAFGLLGPGSTLMVVGYTSDKVSLRLSNLMAFDATAMGNWGCLPEHYPAVVDLVLSGKIALSPFIEHRPLAAINEVFSDLHARRLSRRVILIPESEEARSCN
jgi:6-hydroxycyclohex-1-ene-1-carbonyl-CoA dehydrogenase